MAMPTRQGDPLSEQERKVLSYLAQGLDYSGVGVVLGITQSTVRSHTKNIHNKLNVNKTVQAVVKYEEMLHEESLVNLRAEACPSHGGTVRHSKDSRICATSSSRLLAMKSSRWRCWDESV